MSFHDIINADRGGSGGILGVSLNRNSGADNYNPPESDSLFGEGDLFGKGGTASIALGGLKTLGSIWNSFQQNKLAKKSLKFQKQAFETNLANSTKVYNTALEDRIRARYATEGRSEQANSYIEANRLGGGQATGQPIGRRINLEE